MKLTAAEWLIMNVLWENHPAKARDVSQGLPEGVNWAYTTVKTMLTRLAEKKAVSETKVGNTSLYKPLLSRQKARQSALRILVDQAFNGAFGPLMHFLVEEGEVSAKQKKNLITILQKQNKKKG